MTILFKQFLSTWCFIVIVNVKTFALHSVPSIFVPSIIPYLIIWLSIPFSNCLWFHSLLQDSVCPIHYSDCQCQKRHEKCPVISCKIHSQTCPTPWVVQHHEFPLYHFLAAISQKHLQCNALKLISFKNYYPCYIAHLSLPEGFCRQKQGPKRNICNGLKAFFMIEMPA